jgi:hypothetical protein
MNKPGNFLLLHVFQNRPWELPESRFPPSFRFSSLTEHHPVPHHSGRGGAIFLESMLPLLQCLAWWWVGGGMEKVAIFGRQWLWRNIDG